MSDMKLSLLIPVYNESAHLKDFFEFLMKQEFECPVEYIFIDDCSKDNSFDILNELVSSERYKDREIRLLRQDRNKGKGAALHWGIDSASGDIIAVQDADFEYDPAELNKLIRPILDDRADVVYGSRFKRGVQVHRTYHYFVNRFLTMMSNLFSGLYLTDMETCYKVFRSEIPKNFWYESKRFGFEPEVTAYVSKLNCRFHEYPISYYPRSYTEGKKINWKDGVAAMYFIYKYNLCRGKKAIRDTMPEKYLPSKLRK